MAVAECDEPLACAKILSPEHWQNNHTMRQGYDS